MYHWPHGGIKDKVLVSRLVLDRDSVSRLRIQASLVTGASKPALPKKLSLRQFASAAG